MLVNQKRMAALATVLLGLAGASAFATPVTFYFGGEITRADDANGLLQGGIEVGDSFFGSYTFELDTPDSSPTDPIYGNYLGAINAMSFRAGNLRLSAPGFGTWIAVENNGFGGGDSYQVITPILFETHGFNLILSVFDQDGSFFNSDALLAVPPSLTTSETHQFSFTRQGTGVNVDGDLRLLSVVPEPATGVLVLIGGMVAILRRRKGTHSESHHIHCLTNQPRVCLGVQGHNSSRRSIL